MKSHPAIALIAPLIVAATLGTATVARAATAPAAAIAWREAANEVDIERAYTVARKESKPVLLYWGASWCPPCNKLKATLFNRQDFISQSRAFVAVHVDGDLPSAQKLGSKFKVRGYPTLILFNPQGNEITRLPGEVEPAQIMSALHLALAGGRAAKDLLADARAGKALSANDWRMLAYYSWETDEAQLLPADQLADTLADLARRKPAPDDEVTQRLWLKALAASDGGKGLAADDALRAKVAAMLRDPAQARAQMDVLINYAANLARALSAPNTPDRTMLLTQLDAALALFQADATLSRADRVATLTARIDLARLDQADDAVQINIADSLRQETRDLATRMEREITDGYERQAVITETAYMLGRAGLWAESDALLKANLAKSHSPYYLMNQLAGNARKQGNTAAALDWYGQAYATSRGPATRLQWGSNYIAALVDLAPDDATRISSATARVFKDAAGDRSAFHERSARSLKRVAEKLAHWNTVDADDARLKLSRQLDAVCRKLKADDPQRATCGEIVATVAAAAS